MNTEVKMATVTIDGIDVTVPAGTLLVEAAKMIQREIPVYCYHTKLGPAGLCRICLVEIEGMPKLQIACNTPVADKMVVRTVGEKADEGRRAVLELLLLNHPLDCPICDKGGECDLQDFSMAYGQGSSRLADAKSSKPKAVDLGPTIVLDEERCILCLRCVRFDDIITREYSLRTEDRGAHAIITTASGHPYESDFSGNVTELCPVGALTSKTYRFKSRPWDNHRTTTTCTQCSVGCQMHTDSRQNTLLRTMSVEQDDAISDGWLCDRGRYNIGFLTDQRRITSPLYKVDGEWQQIGWDDAIALWAKSIDDGIAQHGAASVGAIGGGRLLNEEAFLLQHVMRAKGVENLDWRSGRQYQAHPGDFGGTHTDLEAAQAILTYGRPPAQTAPILDLRIRKAVSRHDAALISIGDFTASTVIPDRHVATVADAKAALPASAERIAFVWDGSTSAEAETFFALANALRAAGKHVTFFIAGEQPNARGAESMGMLPRKGGMDSYHLLAAAAEGKVHSLAFLGVNPMLRFPHRGLIEAALEKTPFVVVSELFMTETAERATLILPVCSAFEKTGTTTDLAGDVLPVNAAVPAPEGVLADGDLLVALASELGIAIPLPAEIEARVRQLAAAPEPVERMRPRGAMPAPPPAGSLRLVIATSIFTGGGTVAFDDRLHELRPHAHATLHPKTAARMNLTGGDVIDLTTPDGTIHDLVVMLQSHAPLDAAVLLDGLPGSPVTAFARAEWAAVANVRKFARELASGAAGE